MAAYRARSGALHCAFCRYPLDGLPAHDPRRRRCPECGAPYWTSSLERAPWTPWRLNGQSAVVALTRRAAGVLTLSPRTGAIVAFIVGAAIITTAFAVGGYESFCRAVGVP